MMAPKYAGKQAQRQDKKQDHEIERPAANHNGPTSDATKPAPSKMLFQKLESLEHELETGNNTGHSRWMIPYADLLTLLLGLFLVLFSATQTPPKSGPEPSGAPSSIVKLTSSGALKNSAQRPMTDQNSMEHQDMGLAATLQQQLTEGLHLKDIEVRQQERGLVISLKDSILFAPGNADLSPQAKQTLDRLAQQLNTSLGAKTRPIRVEGHTDNTPIHTSRYPSNWELSTARATNIVRYLIASHQFAPDKLSAAGYGEFKPVRNNSSIEGKQKNRRVDIVVLNESTAQQEPPSLTEPVSQTARASASVKD